MTNLNQFHPFRASVDSTGPLNIASTSIDQSSNNNSGDSKKDKDDIERVPMLSWKTKLRLLVFGLVGICFFFIFSNVYSSISPLLENFGSGAKQEVAKKGSKKEEIFQASVYDKDDLNDRGRSVDEARKKSGFFQGLFCKGGKRAGFCSN